jgi:hypothetical protein
VAAGLTAVDNFGAFFHDRNLPINMLLSVLNTLPRSVFKTSDQVQGQGAGRSGKSLFSAYMGM